MTRKRNVSRRTVLKTTAAGTVIALGATAVTAQEDAFDPDEEILLGGQRSAWIGEAPEEIADERNPTLHLAEGEEYTLTWENLDGDGHNFVIEDDEGENIVDTDIISGTGSTQTVEFTATDEMHEYYCAPHPASMRGAVEIVDDPDDPVDEPVDDEVLDTVVGLPGEEAVENLAIDDDGSLYFSVVAGEVRRLTPEQTVETDLTLEDVEQVGVLDGEAYGVEITPDGTLYVAVQAGEETGLWRIPRDDVDDEPVEDVVEGEPYAIVGVEDEIFPNEVEYDEERDRLLFTESFDGAVYEAPLDADDPDDAASVWFEDERLDTEAVGANGLTIGPEDDLFVAVTEDEVDGEDAGRILRVPVDEEGEAGEAETYVEGPEVYGANGIEFGPDEMSLYVAANFQDAVLRVDPDQEVETVASAEDGLVAPLDVTFGTTEEQGDDLFISNFAPEEPEESAVFRMGAEEIDEE